MFGSGDPDNPMGGLLGDLMKVIGSGPGAADSWFEAARTLAFGVAADGGEDENPDPLVRIAFEELARVAELHVVEATGIDPTSGAGGVSFEAVGPGQWSFRVLEAYRPVLKAMVEAQQQGAAAVPSSLDLSELDPDSSAGLGGLLGQFALTLGPVFLGDDFFDCQRRSHCRTRCAHLHHWCFGKSDFLRVNTFHQLMGKLISEGKGCGVDPTLPTVPSFDVGRKKGNLTHLAERKLDHIRVRQLNGQGAEGLRKELHGAFDL